jgi:PAS domain S-box-containing protein
LLAARYLIYSAVILAYYFRWTGFQLQDVVLVAGVALVQNIFCHWVLYTRHYSRFFTPWNLGLNLFHAAVLVFFTGGDTSPLIGLFLVIFVGCNVYAPGNSWGPWISVLVCAVYSFTVLTDWGVNGLSGASITVYSSLALMALCGWLMREMGRMLRHSESSARRRARELLSSGATLRAILDNAAEPIVVYGENEFIAEANSQACSFFGVIREELIGKRFREFLFDDGLLPERMETAHQTGRFHEETLVLLSDGSERTVDMRIHSFIRDQRHYYVAVLRDITEQKDLEESQRQAQERLQALNNELQRVNALREELYSNVARRLRSPLSAILGFVGMLIDEETGELNDEQRTALQSCRRSARRALDMVDEVIEPSLAEVPRPRATASSETNN